MLPDAEPTICVNLMNPYLRVALWYSCPKESTGPLLYLQVYCRTISPIFTSAFYSAEGWISMEE